MAAGQAIKWKSQEAARAAFEKYTGRPFPSVRPPWLQRLELDGYNAELGIAFEYNGKQHYQMVAQFHRAGKDDLAKQHERDARKNYLCCLQGVVLITVPYTVPVAGLPEYVATALEHVQALRPNGPRLRAEPPPPGSPQPEGPQYADKPTSCFGRCFGWCFGRRATGSHN